MNRGRQLNLNEVLSRVENKKIGSIELVKFLNTLTENIKYYYTEYKYRDENNVEIDSSGDSYDISEGIYNYFDVREKASGKNEIIPSNFRTWTKNIK